VDIERRAANRKGAEPKVVASSDLPEIVHEQGRLVLRARYNPSPNDDGTEYDYTVYLSAADVERLRRVLISESPNG
jgi:hypothetical protein